MACMHDDHKHVKAQLIVNEGGLIPHLSTTPFIMQKGQRLIKASQSSMLYLEPDALFLRNQPCHASSCCYTGKVASKPISDTTFSSYQKWPWKIIDIEIDQMTSKPNKSIDTIFSRKVIEFWGQKTNLDQFLEKDEFFSIIEVLYK